MVEAVVGGVRAAQGVERRGLEGRGGFLVRGHRGEPGGEGVLGLGIGGGEEAGSGRKTNTQDTYRKSNVKTV